MRFRRGGDPLAYASSFGARYNPSPYALRIGAGVCFVPPTVPVGPSAVYAVFGRVHAVSRVRLRPRLSKRFFASSVVPGEALPCLLPAASPAVVHRSVPVGAAVVPAGSACRRAAVFAFYFSQGHDIPTRRKSQPPFYVFFVFFGCFAFLLKRTITCVFYGGLLCIIPDNGVFPGRGGYILI